MDFFECVNSRLQIVTLTPEMHATILKMRGRGEFKITIEFEDENESLGNEIIWPQAKNSFPFTSKEIFNESEEIENYIRNEVEK